MLLMSKLTHQANLTHWSFAPWSAYSSKDYVQKLIKAIVGFSIEVESFDNVFKLSQNHHEETRQSIEAHLLAKGDEHSTAIAKEMTKVNSATPAP